jgi:hypothetical protein
MYHIFLYVFPYSNTRKNNIWAFLKILFQFVRTLICRTITLITNDSINTVVV